MSDKTDMVNNPPHYNDESGIECIEVTKHMGFLGGNCFKYLYRAGQKGCAIEDLKKAAWYADMAWEQEDIVPDEALDDVRRIASHRTGNIRDAMLFVADDHWSMVERLINSEIKRLEGAK